MKHIVDLIQFKDKIQDKRLVVVNAHDDIVLKAVSEAVRIAHISPILVGKENKIKEIMKKEKLNIKEYQIIDVDDDVLAAQTSIDLIRNEEADFLMKGLVDTKVLLKAVVNRETGIRKHKILSHVTAIEYPVLNKVMFLTDCAMMPNPTVEQKIEIIENALTLTARLNINNPKVALISAVEKVNPTIQSSIDADEIVQYYKKHNSKLLVDGPFAIDNVVSKEAAAIKGITSPVADEPDIIVVPNIDAGNVLYKTSMYLAGAQAASIVIGAKVPIILTSRADSFENKLYSILLAGVYSDDL